MTAGEVLARKRRGAPHSREEIEFLVHGACDGSISDYQLSAWLMAVAIQGMTPDEIMWLTESMAASGDRLELKARWPDSVDKHSTGGVGDKASLVLMPMLAASGCHVAKMSGRGLGFSGGTADKLEAIPGMRVDLSRAEFLAQVDRIGIAMACQSADLAPADGKLYALRDVTTTVDSLPLIASSIMSKKLAIGAARLVLDVKVGGGAFMKTLPQAQELASAMVAIGRAAGIATSAVISDMSQPEGRAIGNALEVREAIEVLHRRGPGDVGALVEALGSTLGVELRRAGAAEKLAEMIDAQGGDARVVDEPDRLPSARFRRFVAPPLHGYVASIDAEALGRIAVGLGAGRARKGDVIDPAVGLVLEAKIGDWTDAQQPLAIVHANDEARLEEALSRLPDAYTFSNESVRPPEQILGVSKAP